MATRARSEVASTIALDSGAVIALSRSDRDVFTLVKRLRLRGGYFVVPAPVLAETLRGGSRDAPVHRVLEAFQLEDTTARDARDAGRRLGLARSRSVVDALIVATAVRAGATIMLTSDPSDLEPLSRGDLTVAGI